MTLEFPAPPLTDDLIGHFKLSGPDPAPLRFGSNLVRYRIIDSKHRNRSVLTIIGMQGDERLRGTAETAFAEYKRRIVYHAHQNWQRETEPIRQERLRAASGNSTT